MASSPTTQTLWGVCAGNGLFVAVGEGGTIITSADALNWIARTSGTSKWLLDAKWSPSARVFAVVGDAGTILTSPDVVVWTARASGTTQRLNSIVYGDGVFLAVGENGTALTSLDGITWTLRETGERGWLRGLAFGRGTFVATGHNGTILTTSDRGMTFQRRGIVTTLDLDAVTFTGTRFELTGSEFVRARSDDGVFWVINNGYPPRQPGLVYNGLVWFNNALIVVGDQGRILDENGIELGSFSSGPNWRAVTSGAPQAVAVGSGGAIATAPNAVGGFRGVAIAADVGPAWFPPFSSPPPKIELGDHVVLHAVNAFPTPVAAHQWSLNNQPIAGATADILTIDSMTLAQTGTYRVTATVANGSISSSLDLIAAPGPSQLNLFDESFRCDLPTDVSVAPMIDGAIYVAKSQLFFSVNGHLQHGVARLKPDGSVDPTFDAGSGLGFEVVSPSDVPAFYVPQLFVQADGRLVVRGAFSTVNGVSSPALARFNLDGSVDRSFQPDPALRDYRGALVTLADGRWLTASSAADAAGNRTVKLARFSRDGSADPSFSSVLLAAPFAAPVGLTTAASVLIAIAPQGAIYVATSFGATGSYPFSYFTGKTLLFRLTPDGTSDPTFTVRQFDGEIAELAAGRRGVLCHTTAWSFQRPVTRQKESVIYRLNFDGSVDGSFRPISTGENPWFTNLMIAPDDSIYVETYAARGRSGVVHFDVNGDYDRNVVADFEPPGGTWIRLMPDGRLLVPGRLRRPDGTIGYLHVLVPNRAAASTRLSNLSVRARIQAERPLIVGFVTAGGSKTFLARAAGPALAPFGVSDALADPEITLIHEGAAVTSNDNWAIGSAPAIAAAGARLGAFPFAQSSQDAALLVTVDPGAYSFHTTDHAGASGVALAELYDSDPAAADDRSPRLINFSALTTAGSGENTLMAGFTVAGNNTRRLLIRAVGPGMTRFGVSGTLTDPVLTVFRDGIPIATNDNWIASRDALAEAARAVGAFAHDDRGNDAALLLSLPPGSYTAQVKGPAATGAALLEVYEVP